MEITLIVAGGTTKRTHTNLAVPAIIGRSREADLTIAHPTVSRQHCELFEADGLLRIRDLGSLNGTFVGGKAVTEAPLRPSAEFSVGPLTFRVDYEYGGEVTAEGPDTEAESDRRPPAAEDVLELISEEPAPAPQEPQGMPSAGAEAHDAPPPRSTSGLEATIPAQGETFPSIRESPGLASHPAPTAPLLGVAPPDGQLPDFSAWDERVADLIGPAGPSPGEPSIDSEPTPAGSDSVLPDAGPQPPLGSKAHRALPASDSDIDRFLEGMR